MLDHEYDTMRSVEDAYWWYQALRGSVVAEMARLYPAGSPCRVLDAGCGTGGMMESLRRTNPEWDLAGIDISPLAVAHTRQRGFADVWAAGIDDIPCSDGAWDAVVCLDVLYHAAVDEPRAMTELFRVLRPGGHLLLNLPAFDCLAGGHDVAVQGARRYTTGGVERLLSRHGFRVRRLFYWNALMFPAVLIWRQLSRHRPAAAQPNAKSDLGALPGALNRALLKLARLDIRVGRTLHLPFGTSVFAIADKPPPFSTA